MFIAKKHLLYLVFSSMISSQLMAINDGPLISLPCNKEKNISYQISKNKCDGESCSLKLELGSQSKKAKKQDSFISLEVPSLDVEVNKDYLAISELGDKEGKKGKTLLSTRVGKLNKGYFGLMVEKTVVVEVEGLPYSSYSYYVCNNDAIELAWSGGDEGPESSTVQLKDINNDGIDEIVVKGGSFASVGLSGVSDAVFKLNPKTNKMEVKDPEKVVSNESRERDRLNAENEERHNIFFSLFKGQKLNLKEFSGLRSLFKSCDIEKSTVEKNKDGSYSLHCFFIHGPLAEKLTSEVRSAQKFCKTTWDVFGFNNNNDDGNPAHNLITCHFKN